MRPDASARLYWCPSPDDPEPGRDGTYLGTRKRGQRTGQGQQHGCRLLDANFPPSLHEDILTDVETRVCSFPHVDREYKDGWIVPPQIEEYDD